MSKTLLQDLHKDFAIVDRELFKVIINLLKSFLKGRVKRYEYVKIIREMRKNGIEL
jgi:hypothetical protein